MTTPDNVPIAGTRGIGTSKPGIGSKIGNALLSVCLGILKEICEAVLWAVGAVIGFVASVIVETIIELRWALMILLALMGLLWLWMQNDPHRPSTKPYHLDPSPDRILR